MAKSRAEIVRESVFRRRQRARATGLCCRCCKGKPAPNRVTCAQCLAARIDSQRRKRRSERQERENAKLVDAHERAGDVAREHYYYGGAAQHYKDALDLCVPNGSAWRRISENLATVLHLG